MKERPSLYLRNQSSISTPERSLPPGWPKDVPLPTIEEVEDAVHRVGQRLAAYEKEAIERQPCNEEANDSLERTTVTI